MRNLVVDRIVSALSYLSAGWVGVIYLVVVAIRKCNTTSFLRFNIFQSVFISLLYFCVCFAVGIIMNILSIIPFIYHFVYRIYSFFFSLPIVNLSEHFRYSIVEAGMFLLIAYLTVYSLLGKKPRIYKLSEIVDIYAR